MRTTVPNNIYRFRRIKWGAPAPLMRWQDARRPTAFDWDVLGVVIGLVVIGVLLYFIL